MNQNPFSKLLAFLERLDQAKIQYVLRHSREDALMVVVYAPGQYWEVDFLEDGEIEIERYQSNGHIDDDSVIEELFALWADPETTTSAAVNDNAIPAGK